MTSAVYIAKNVYGGDGLGRLGDGRVVFVPGAWAGEQVKAEIVEEKRHFVKARLVEVVEASSDRLAAADVGETVPGMVYATLSYAAERRAKEAQLREFFDRARIAFPDAATLAAGPADAPFNYRNKVVYHFARQRGKWAIGYRLEPSHEIVDVERDPLAVGAINAELPAIRRAVLSLLTTGPESVRRATAAKENLTVRWSERTGVKWWLGKAPEDLVIKETTCGRVFEVPAGGFYQMNPRCGEALVKRVTELVNARKGAAGRRILDLYCGVGVFGLVALGGDPSAQLTGVESGRQAIDFARRNAAAQGAASVKFFSEEVGRNLRRIPVGESTTVIVDPPRDGLERGVAEWLAASKAPQIVYVSCDPATLTRDLRVLARSYDVTRLEWFDMFPRTARFETLAALTRKA